MPSLINTQLRVPYPNDTPGIEIRRVWGGMGVLNQKEKKMNKSDIYVAIILGGLTSSISPFLLPISVGIQYWYIRRRERNEQEMYTRCSHIILNTPELRKMIGLK